MSTIKDRNGVDLTEAVDIKKRWQVYTCSQSWTPLPSPFPYHPSGSSQCTSPEHPESCIEPRLVIRFLYDIIHVSMKPAFSLSSFTFIKRFCSFSSLSTKGWCHLHIWGYWYFSRQSWFQPVLLPAQCFSWYTLHISQISRITIFSLNVLLFLFRTSLLFHVQF